MSASGERKREEEEKKKRRRREEEERIRQKPLVENTMYHSSYYTVIKNAPQLTQSQTLLAPAKNDGHHI